MNKKTVINNYAISLGTSEYSPETQTGFINIVIEKDNLINDNMFFTHESIGQKGNKVLLDDDYKLAVLFNDKETIHYEYELQTKKTTQEIRVEFIENLDSPDGASSKTKDLYLTITTPGGGTKKIQANYNNITDFHSFESTALADYTLANGASSNAMYAASLSSSGIKVTLPFPNTKRRSNIPLFHNMTLFYKNNRKTVLFIVDPTNPGNFITNYSHLIYAPLNSKNCYFSWPTSDLKNIVKITINDNELHLVKSNEESARD